MRVYAFLRQTDYDVEVAPDGPADGPLMVPSPDVQPGGTINLNLVKGEIQLDVGASA